MVRMFIPNVLKPFGYCLFDNKNSIAGQDRIGDMLDEPCDEDDRDQERPCADSSPAPPAASANAPAAGADSAQDPGDGCAPARMTKTTLPDLELARKNYAEEHGVDPATVTEELLAKTPLGVEGWACKKMDCRAHGPLGNALYRSFKKNPKMASAYKWLFDDLKLKFRQSWAMTRTFDFVSAKRVHTVATTTKQEEVGTWKNALQLEGHFGGVGIPEAKRQAESYIENCMMFEDCVLKRFGQHKA